MDTIMLAFAIIVVCLIIVTFSLIVIVNMLWNIYNNLKMNNMYDEKKYKEVLERAKKLLETPVAFDRFTIESIFPELAESEDERIRNILIGWVNLEPSTSFDGGFSREEIIAWIEKQGEQDTMEIQSEEFDNNIITRDDEILQAISIGLTDVAEDAGWTDFGGLPIEEIQAWIEKQVPFDEEKMLIGARKDVASSIITYLDRNTLGMCLSNMECEDLVNAVVDSDWGKVYDYMKKKLEKQGQKPQGKTAIEAIKEEKVDNANIVEPKFHEGDWVVTDKDGIVQIGAVNKGYYTLNNGMDFSTSYVDKFWRLWTIDDAKPGDVLYYKSDNNIEYIVMNKGINMHDNIDSYFRYNSLDGFAVNVPAVLSAKNDNITLATREQRDLLFSKMKEAGYEWDAENKVLKKIES